LTLLQIIVLAIVQGITEFPPISSSGHLILVPELTSWPDQGIMMDVGVHVGTLGAVILYFRRDVGRMFHAFWQLISLNKNYDHQERKLMLASTLGLTEIWRTIEVIGWTSIIFGILLYIFDTKFPMTLKLSELRYGHAIIIGFAQVLALIPGTSRSGITMTAARGLGFSRVDAARFSLLMSIPTILAAAVLQIKDLNESANITIGSDLVWGAGLSFISAVVAISFLMKWLQTSSMTPFVIYRVLLGIGLLYLVYI
jgi:undecaprenyl-diphosphatase